ERPRAQPRIPFALHRRLERLVVRVDADGDRLLEGAPARKRRRRGEEQRLEALDLSLVLAAVAQIEGSRVRSRPGGEGQVPLHRAGGTPGRARASGKEGAQGGEPDRSHRGRLPSGAWSAQERTDET